MGRLTELTSEAMTEAQRRVWHNSLNGQRSLAFGLHNAWLRSPELAGRLIDTGLFLREHLTLAPRLRELAILIIARRSDCAFAWARHEDLAREAGIEPGTLSALAAGQRPTLTDPTDKLVYDICDRLDRTRTLDDEIYRRSVASLGEQALSELVTVVGYYVMATMTLNAFDVRPHEPVPF